MPPVIEPRWPAPANVHALCTTRRGGCSEDPYASFNLGGHVGDSEAAVDANRAKLMDLLPGAAQVQWLQQVHGTEVVAAGTSAAPVADACWTGRARLACAVLTADCLPVLFCDRAGSTVAAAHAGWRGLAAGVLEAAVAAMPVPPGDLLAWLGPAIGPQAFEVGEEVRVAFIDAVDDADLQTRVAGCFVPASRAAHFYADLYGLARLRLARAGVTAVYGGDHCTFTEQDTFFSYRRDGQTGRIASLILRL